MGTRASPRSPSSMSRIEAWKAANRPMCRLSFPPKPSRRRPDARRSPGSPSGVAGLGESDPSRWPGRLPAAPSTARPRGWDGRSRGPPVEIRYRLVGGTPGLAADFSSSNRRREPRPAPRCSRIVLEPRLVPPWRRNRWAGSGAGTIDAPTPMATVVALRHPPARSATNRRRSATRRLAAGQSRPSPDYPLRVVALAGNVMRRGRPICRTVRRTAGSACAGCCATGCNPLDGQGWRPVGKRSRRALPASRQAPTSRIEVSRHRGGSMTLALRAGQDEPVLVGLQIKRGALPPSASPVGWSYGRSAPSLVGRMVGRIDSPRSQPLQPSR